MASDYPFSSYAVDPGTPDAYTMLNVHDSGQITFLPTPDGCTTTT